MSGDPSASGDDFDPDLYVASNPDLRRALDAGLIATARAHWRSRGMDEIRAGSRPTILGLPTVAPRSPDPERARAAAAGLDAATYRAMNPDVAAAYGEDDDATRRHWAWFGSVEGRVGPGGSVPWRRDRPAAADLAAAPRGCDLFLDADPDGGAEAVLGRRILGLLRAAGTPVSVRCFGIRDGALVIDPADLARPAAYDVAVIAAAPAALRLLLAAHPPERFERQRLLGAVARAPLDRQWRDGPVLASLDAVLVPCPRAAAHLAARLPVPVHALALAAVPLAQRAAARRRLGLPLDRRIVLVAGEAAARARPGPDRDGALLVGAAGTAAPDGARLVDDRRDAWTGASLLLAAVDAVREGDGSAPGLDAVDRIDAIAAGLPFSPAPPGAAAPGPLAAVAAALVERLGAADAPRPRAAVPETGDPRALLSVLADATSLDRAGERRLVSRLPGGVPVELCLAVRAGTSPLAGDVFDPRVRRLPVETDAPRTPGTRLAMLLDIASGGYVAPVFADGRGVEDAAARLLGALPTIAPLLGEVGAPDALVAFAEATREADAACADPIDTIRDRIEACFAVPLVVRRAVLDAVGGFDPSAGAATPYALALALCRAEARLVAWPPGDATGDATDDDFPPSLPEAARRVLRHHLRRTVGADARLRPGRGWLSFRIERRPRPRPAITILWPARFGAPPVPAPWRAGDVVLRIGDDEAPMDVVARIETAFVLLLDAPSVPADPDAIAALVDRATDASVAAACASLADAGAGGADPVTTLVVRRTVLLAASAAMAEANPGLAGALLRALSALGLRVAHVAPATFGAVSPVAAAPALGHIADTAGTGGRVV